MQIIDKSTYKLPRNVQKILLIQLGDIGDVVWTTPGIRAVKNSFPAAKVFVMVKEHFGGLLAADPCIEKIYEIKRYPGNIFQQAAGLLSFLKQLRAEHFDLAVDLRLGDRGAFMAFATGAPIRITMHHPAGVPFWRKYLFTQGIVPGPKVHTRGAADQTLGILRKIGIDTQDVIPRLWIADSVKRRIKEILIAEKADNLQHWITINPFSRWPYKEWDDSQWIAIINWLWQDLKIPTIIIGSAEERFRADALTRQCSVGVINLAGKTTLAELAGVLSLSRLHIGVDSAAPHIAAATGTPTVTIYGPSSWQDWAPPGKDHRVVFPDRDCVPCRQKGCDNSGRSRCLEELGIDKVMNVIAETIKDYPTND